MDATSPNSAAKLKSAGSSNLSRGLFSRKQEILTRFISGVTQTSSFPPDSHFGTRAGGGSAHPIDPVKFFLPVLTIKITIFCCYNSSDSLYLIVLIVRISKFNYYQRRGACRRFICNFYVNWLT